MKPIFEQSCAKQVCHGLLTQSAHLDFMQHPRAALVDVPSCEYDRMMRVKPFDPEHSWIMVKLAGPVRFRQYADFVEFTPDADWRPSIQECTGQFDDGSPWFGVRMPPMDTTTITPEQIDLIEAWIRSGAPGV